VSACRSCRPRRTCYSSHVLTALNHAQDQISFGVCRLHRCAAQVVRLPRAYRPQSRSGSNQLRSLSACSPCRPRPPWTDSHVLTDLNHAQDQTGFGVVSARRSCRPRRTWRDSQVLTALNHAQDQISFGVVSACRSCRPRRA